MPVRWNSAYNMCVRLQEQRAAVENYAYQKERRDLNLTDPEWASLEELVRILSPLQELTDLFCGSHISVVFPYSLMTKDKLRNMEVVLDDAKRVKELLVDGIQRRFENLLSKK